jgi:uncharacterized membrane protein YhaH (DUF805 family)
MNSERQDFWLRSVLGTLLNLLLVIITLFVSGRSFVSAMNRYQAHKGWVGEVAYALLFSIAAVYYTVRLFPTHVKTHGSSK